MAASSNNLLEVGPPSWFCQFTSPRQAALSLEAYFYEVCSFNRVV